MNCITWNHSSRWSCHSRWPTHRWWETKWHSVNLSSANGKSRQNQRDSPSLLKQVGDSCQRGKENLTRDVLDDLEMEHMIPDVPLVTLPVPVYLPSPTPSYRLFKPKAVPIPVPFFVPIMIPIPRKTYKNIREYLQVRLLFLDSERMSSYFFLEPTWPSAGWSLSSCIDSACGESRPCRESTSTNEQQWSRTGDDDGFITGWSVIDRRDCVEHFFPLIISNRFLRKRSTNDRKPAWTWSRSSLYWSHNIERSRSAKGRICSKRCQ